jgi:hypothetical protein
MVVGSVLFLPAVSFCARGDFILTCRGRDNFPADAGWLEAGYIAPSAMLSCLTELRERWKIVDLVCLMRVSSSN